ncbi:hypothetical protein H5T51_01235, partial [Candidatus Bathyarchaeota archaeon]|nr:hypothetical protein [Candidatus Bathyarchaeota archaeon]
IEQLGVNEADGIIVKSEWTAEETQRIYKAPSAKIMIANLEKQNGLKAILATYKCVKR